MTFCNRTNVQKNQLIHITYILVNRIRHNINVINEVSILYSLRLFFLTYTY